MYQQMQGLTREVGDLRGRMGKLDGAAPRVSQPVGMNMGIADPILGANNRI
jgi:hypothetical protein